MTQEHKHAEILRALADNKDLEIEYFDVKEDEWKDITNPQYTLFYNNLNYRIKPQEKIYTFGDKFIIKENLFKNVIYRSIIIQVSLNKGLLVDFKTFNRLNDISFDLPITLNQLNYHLDLKAYNRTIEPID